MRDGSKVCCRNDFDVVAEISEIWFSADGSIFVCLDKSVGMPVESSPPANSEGLGTNACPFDDV